MLLRLRIRLIILLIYMDKPYQKTLVQPIPPGFWKFNRRILYTYSQVT